MRLRTACGLSSLSQGKESVSGTKLLPPLLPFCCLWLAVAVSHLKGAAITSIAPQPSTSVAASLRSIDVSSEKGVWHT